MKLIALLVLGASLSVSAGVNGQTISLSLENAPVKNVFRQIKKQTGYTFVYREVLLQQTKNVTIDVKNASIRQVLDICLQGQPLEYTIVDNIIVIKEKKFIAVEAPEIITSPQPIGITGKITNEQGEPLAGASVKEKGTENGTVTKDDGSFSFNVPDRKAIIVISYVGYETREIIVGTQSAINVQMSLAVTSMTDMVIIGYGTVKKKDLTGSVVSLRSEQITSTPVTNVLETMQGKVPGLDLTRSSGEAGAGLNFTLRGNRSLNASNTPLILVDGIQYGNYVDVNPNDVASIEVLKDASSTAIYGSRGANGVILITTKSGKGKTKVEVNSYFGLNSLSDYDRPGDLNDYISITREAYRAANQWATPADDSKIFGSNWANIQKGVNTSWVDHMLHEGTVQSYHAAVSGGSDKTTFRLSSEFFNEKGFLRNDQLKRFVQHLNVDHKVGDKLKVGAIINFNSSNQDRRNTSFWTILNRTPFGVPFNDDGSVKMYPWPGTLDLNPLLDESKSVYTNNTTSNRIFMVGFAEYNILKELSFKTNFGIDIYNSQQGIYEDKTSSQVGLNGGFSKSQMRDNKSRNWTWENVLNYNKNFRDHSLNVMLGTSMISSRSTLLTAEGKNQPFPTAAFFNLGSNVRDIIIASSLSENKLASGFGRINYKFKNKYLLTASLRADGASVLAEGNKWAYFPSVALAWRASDEKFLAGAGWLSDLKFRASYGISGNSAIQPYQTQGGLGRVPYAFDETPAIGYWPKLVANQTLGWEKTATFNGGVDFGFFNNRVVGTIDVYKTNTYDLLMQRILPTVTGFNSIIDNVGKTKTSGIDIGISTRNYSTSKFTWTTDFNFSVFKEKIAALSVGGDDISNGWFIGQPIRVFYDYEKIGIWQTKDKDLAATYNKIPGEIRVKDQNADGKFTANNDRVVLGQASPKWTAGLTNTFSYKNLSLSVLVYARYGQMISSDYAGAYYTGGIFNTAVVDYWTPENPTNAYPRPRTNANDQYLSTLKYLDGSFIKIKDVRMAYNFSKTGLKKLPFSNLTAYVTAKNYFTFSEVRNYDPERGGSAEYPLTKQLVFGLNVSF